MGVEGWEGRFGLHSDIYQRLNEHCTLLMKNLILVLRSENVRECQTLDAEKLTEIGGGGSGASLLL